MQTYVGNSAYCFTHSLHMCLRISGMPDVPDVGMLECMTGMPFGACFLNLESPLFFPSPSSANPDAGLTRALETIGWTCALRRFEEASAATTALEEALSIGPVLIGPLDMGYLPYDPGRSLKRGADHFVVALKITGDVVQVHDPQLYPFAVLPLDDLAKAWNAKHLGYSEAAYTFRCGFRGQRVVSPEQMIEQTLSMVKQLVASSPAGPVVYGGPQAYQQAAELLRKNPGDAFTESLKQFALPLGARRCIDAAVFFDAAGMPEAASLMVRKAEVFGQTQYYAVQNDWERIAEGFTRLSGIESELAGTL